VRLTVFAALMAVMMAQTGPAGAVSMRGGVSGSYYNHDDDISAQDRSVTRFKVRLDVSDFMAYDSAFHLRTITRSVSGHDYNDNLPSQRIDQAEFEMSGLMGFMDLHLGRMFVADLPGARVDGADLEFHLGQSFGFGLMGGQTPDPFSDQINSSYSTYGAYLFNRSQTSRFSLGYVATSKGAEDSTYLSGMYYSVSSSAFSWMADVRMDEEKKKSQWQLTEAMVNMTYRPNRRFKVNASYNEYRGIRLFESMKYDADYSLQRTMRVSGDIYILQNSLVYLRIDGRSRDIDSGTATLFTGGYRQDNMMGFMFLDFSYDSINYFKTNSSRMNFRVGADLNWDLQADFEITSISTTQEGQRNSMTQLVYGATLDWRFEGFFVSAQFQMSDEKFLDVASVYTNKASDHFAATSYYLSVGYNF